MITRRKEIYEELHPETRAGVAGAEARHHATEIISFASDTASKTGKTPRTIEQEVQISKNIVPEVRCYTQEAIAEELQIGIATVNSIINKEFGNSQMAKSEETFKPELYTIWNFSKLGEGVET